MSSTTNHGDSESTTTTASNANKSSSQVSQVPKDKHSVSKRLQQELLSLMMSSEKGKKIFYRHKILLLLSVIKKNIYLCYFV